MFTRRYSLLAAMIACVIVAGALVSTRSRIGIAQTTAIPVVEKTANQKVYYIPAAAFANSSQFEKTQNRVAFNVTGYIEGEKPTPSPNEYAYAPVYLPQGAEIKLLTGYIWDTVSSTPLSLHLSRTAKFGQGANDEIARIDTTKKQASIQKLSTNTITNGKVDNDNYTYYVTFTVVSTVSRLYAVDISYSAP